MKKLILVEGAFPDGVSGMTYFTKKVKWPDKIPLNIDYREQLTLIGRYDGTNFSLLELPPEQTIKRFDIGQDYNSIHEWILTKRGLLTQDGLVYVGESRNEAYEKAFISNFIPRQYEILRRNGFFSRFKNIFSKHH